MRPLIATPPIPPATMREADSSPAAARQPGACLPRRVHFSAVASAPPRLCVSLAAGRIRWNAETAEGSTIGRRRFSLPTTGAGFLPAARGTYRGIRAITLLRGLKSTLQIASTRHVTARVLARRAEDVSRHLCNNPRAEAARGGNAAERACGRGIGAALARRMRAAAAWNYARRRERTDIFSASNAARGRRFSALDDRNSISSFRPFCYTGRTSAVRRSPLTVGPLPRGAWEWEARYFHHGGTGVTKKEEETKKELNRREQRKRRGIPNPRGRHLCPSLRCHCVLPFQSELHLLEGRAIVHGCFSVTPW